MQLSDLFPKRKLVIGVLQLLCGIDWGLLLQDTYQYAQKGTGCKANISGGTTSISLGTNHMVYQFRSLLLTGSVMIPS